MIFLGLTLSLMIQCRDVNREHEQFNIVVQEWAVTDHSALANAALDAIPFLSTRYAATRAKMTWLES